MEKIPHVEMQRIHQSFFAGDFHQFFGLLGFGCERLFANHVLARQQRGFRLWIVQKVGRANVNAGNVRIVDQFLKIAVGTRNAQLVGFGSGKFGVGFGQPQHFNVWQTAQRLNVGRPDEARTGNGNFDFVHGKKVRLA